MSSEAARRAAERIESEAVYTACDGRGDCDLKRAAAIIEEELGKDTQRAMNAAYYEVARQEAERDKPGEPVFYSVDSVSGEVRGLWNSETGQTDPLPEGHVPDLCYGGGGKPPSGGGEGKEGE